jgi:HAD superfamily hydrolase (TIGR01490 family)
MTKEKTLVLFDFDGTLTKGDTMLPFLWHCSSGIGFMRRIFEVMIQFVGLFVAGKWQPGRAKEILIGRFFKGISAPQIRVWGRNFCEKRLPKLLEPVTIAEMKRHQDAGAQVWVVSASCNLWLETFCADNRLGLLCTELGMQNEMCTGKFATPNCNGAEKVRRIKAAIDLTQFSKIVAYGNTSGDMPMLSLATEAWWVRGKSITPLKMDQGTTGR